MTDITITLLFKYNAIIIALQDELTSSYFVTIWKMLRKKGCVPSALTQNVKDLLASRQIENILAALFSQLFIPIKRDRWLAGCFPIR